MLAPAKAHTDSIGLLLIRSMTVWPLLFFIIELGESLVATLRPPPTPQQQHRKSSRTDIHQVPLSIIMVQSPRERDHPNKKYMKAKDWAIICLGPRQLSGHLVSLLPNSAVTIDAIFLSVYNFEKYIYAFTNLSIYQSIPMNWLSISLAMIISH